MLVLQHSIIHRILSNVSNSKLYLLFIPKAAHIFRFNLSSPEVKRGLKLKKRLIQTDSQEEEEETMEYLVSRTSNPSSPEH